MKKNLHYSFGDLPNLRRALVLALILLICTPTIFAQQSMPRATLNAKNMTFAAVVESLKKQTNYEFIFNAKDVASMKTITVNLKNQPLDVILKELLKDSKLDYTISGKTVAIVPAKPVAATDKQQKIALHGKVLDNDKKPIVGATVIIVGSINGAITDEKGAFMVNVSPSDKLEVAFTGLKTMIYDKPYVAGKELFIIMEPDMMEVSDVVVTGIYERKKESFTGSASTFTQKELKNVGTQNILQSLKSLDPALNIIENNQFGSDPNRTPDMEIRGKTSVMGLKETFGEDPNQPLFILDGFETTLSTIMDLSMDRVASVTILKDATSTAIYGAKAANGVIVVETKAPLRGKLNVSYNGSAIFQFADLSEYNLMNAKEKLEFEVKAGRFDSDNPLAREELRKRYNNINNDINRGVDTYWMSEPLRLGINHRHSLYLQGGDNQMRYGIGLSYNQNNGVMKQSNRDVVSGNVDLIYRVNKISFTNKLTLDYRMSNDPTVTFSDFSRTNPYYRKINADGGYDRFLETNVSDKENALGYEPTVYTVGNPMWNYTRNSYNNDREFSVTNNLNIEYRPLKTLYFRARFGATKSNGDKKVFRSPEDTQFANVDYNKRGSYRNQQYGGFNYEGDITAIYGALFGEKHQVNAVIGSKILDNSELSNTYSTEGFPDGGFSNPSFANTYSPGKPDYLDIKKRSSDFYINSGYSYDNKYLVDLTYRLDGSSVFGIDNRFTNTWSVGIGWNLHKEKFIAKLNLFQNLKIRATIGNPGNQNFGSHQTITSYYFNNNTTNIFGTSIFVDKFGDKDLAWQKTLDRNIGLDVTMFGNRFHITADYYSKHTNPQLASVAIPLSTGATNRLVAVGDNFSSGINATVRYAILYRPENRQNWTLSLSLRNQESYFDNVGDKLSRENSEGMKNSLTRYFDKVSSSALWAVRSGGIDPATGKEVFYTKDSGMSTFEHSVFDEVVVGDSSPILDGVFQSSLFLKGFSLSFSVRYSFGGEDFNSTLYGKVENISSEDLKKNQDRRALHDRWQKPGDISKFKGISLNEVTPISSRFVMPNNYIVLESVRIGYEFDNSLVQKMGISGLSINAYMNDILRISTMKDERGIDYPFARSISMALSFNF